MYNECEHDCDFFKANFPKLSKAENILCDKVLSIEEIGKGLRELPNNKAPGTDGFTADFYKFFWKDIKSYVYDSFISSLKKGILSIEQRRAILTLLPKGDKDIRFLKNWRPLSLLNTDYKILTKTLALRLQKVLPSIIHSNQTSGVKNRYIGENLRILYDTIEYTNMNLNPGIVAFLDFEKAFDSVSWKFLQKTLKAFNFGEYFRQWISIIYNLPECAVINNGHSSKFFTLSRGIRQGCPISAFLFILVAEVMAINVREDQDIRSINLNGSDIKITQYADDTVLYLRDLKSLEEAIKLLENFSLCSGLKLNKEKTEAIQLGLMFVDHTQPKLDIKLVDHPIKSLGLWVGKDLTLSINKNLDEKMKKIKNLINMNKSRNISIKGKVTLLRSIVLPHLLYIASVLPIPTDFIKEIDQLFFDFVWPNGKHHVKKNVLIQEICDGGLKMPDVYSMISALRLTWVKRLLNNKNECTKIAQATSGVPSFVFLLEKKYDNTNVSDVTAFYRNILEEWASVHTTEPSTATEMLNEILWYNTRIKIAGKI